MHSRDGVASIARHAGKRDGGPEERRQDDYLDQTRCADCFTVVEIVDGVVSEEATMVANPPHEEGGCLRPVGLLADAGCNAIVAAGMGMRPLMGFNQAGITVYYDAEHPIVGDAVRAVAAGEAPIMSADQACNHHH